MQSIVRCSRPARPLHNLFSATLCGRTRNFTSTWATREAAGVPWFVDPNPVPQRFSQRQHPPHIQIANPDAPVVPVDAPEVLKILHAQLLKSPHLDTTHLVVSPAVLPPPGPPLPLRMPHGRRKRGGTYAGVSAFDTTGGGIWSWVVTAQVKEGTENRGAIESVVRLVRKTLLKLEPPIPLAPKRRSNDSDWVMVDAGNFAIHVVSKGAREKYFNQVDW